jgi:hypothetical protein
MIGAPSTELESSEMQTISIHHVKSVVITEPATKGSPEFRYNHQQIKLELESGDIIEIDLYADKLENLNG